MFRRILCLLGFHKCQYYTTLSKTKPRKMKMCMYCQKVIKIN